LTNRVRQFRYGLIKCRCFGVREELVLVEVSHLDRFGLILSLNVFEMEECFSGAFDNLLFMLFFDDLLFLTGWGQHLTDRSQKIGEQT
jgi:hypothetical protein